MPKRNRISAEEVQEIEKARKKNKDKTVEKWLEVLMMHAEGKKRLEIAQKTGYGEQYVTELAGEYCRKGLGFVMLSVLLLMRPSKVLLAEIGFYNTFSW